MRMKVPLLALVVLALALGAYFAFKQVKPQASSTQRAKEVGQESKIIDYKASFLIFTNGTRRDFTAERYHNLNDFAYIEPTTPTTVIVKKGGVTWGEFFATLPMKLEKDCLTTGTGQKFCSGTGGILKFYINGEKVEDFLEHEIKDGERALITFGNESEAEIQRQMSKVPNP